MSQAANSARLEDRRLAHLRTSAPPHLRTSPPARTTPQRHNATTPRRRDATTPRRHDATTPRLRRRARHTERETTHNHDRRLQIVRLNATLPHPYSYPHTDRPTDRQTDIPTGPAILFVAKRAAAVLTVALLRPAI
ncbi:unnamed protein product, partial [Protopolystoma xenopodis]